MPILIIILLAIIGLITYLIFRYRKKRYTFFVLENSFALQELRKINESFLFDNVVSSTETYTYDNEKFYNSISCLDYLIYQLQFKSAEVSQQIRKINANNERYPKYQNKVSVINCFGTYSKPTEKLNINYLNSIEKELFSSAIKHPVLDYNIKVVLYCSKINGEVYYSKSDIYNIEQIGSLIHRLNNKTGYFYNDREIWDSICRVERGKVSNKMRFAIYKRDGYKCRKCGKTGLDDDLEIDHIKPIAKGGKSTYDNLQTLCKRCNKEKGDTYYK